MKKKETLAYKDFVFLMLHLSNEELRAFGKFIGLPGRMYSVNPGTYYSYSEGDAKKLYDYLRKIGKKDLVRFILGKLRNEI